MEYRNVKAWRICLENRICSFFTRHTTNNTRKKIKNQTTPMTIGCRYFVNSTHTGKRIMNTL